MLLNSTNVSRSDSLYIILNYMYIHRFLLFSAKVEKLEVQYVEKLAMA